MIWIVENISLVDDRNSVGRLITVRKSKYKPNKHVVTYKHISYTKPLSKYALYK
jgi:hypothetical protein